MMRVRLDELSWPDEAVERVVLEWCARFRPARADLFVLKALAEAERDALVVGVETMLASSEGQEFAPVRVLLAHMSAAVGRSIERPRPFVRGATKSCPVAERSFDRKAA